MLHFFFFVLKAVRVAKPHCWVCIPDKTKALRKTRAYELNGAQCSTELCEDLPTCSEFTYVCLVSCIAANNGCLKVVTPLIEYLQQRKLEKLV